MYGMRGDLRPLRRRWARAGDVIASIQRTLSELLGNEQMTGASIEHSRSCAMCGQMLRESVKAFQTNNCGASRPIRSKAYLLMS